MFEKRQAKLSGEFLQYQRNTVECERSRSSRMSTNDDWFYMWQTKRVYVPFIDCVYLIFSSKDHPIRWRSTVIESLLIHVVGIKVSEQQKVISNLLHKENIQYEFYAVIYDLYRFLWSLLFLLGFIRRPHKTIHSLTQNQSILIRLYW